MKTFKQIIESKDNWTKHGIDSYSTEASSLGKNGSGRNICPKCSKPFSRSDLEKTLKQYTGTEDEETSGWEFRHNCGAKLTIWND